MSSSSSSASLVRALEQCYTRFACTALPIDASFIESQFLRIAQVPATQRGSLHGRVIGVKSNLSIANRVTHAGSAVLERYVAPFDATVVRRVRDAGAVLVDGGNMDEFGMGGTTTSSGVGQATCRNPRDPTRIAGGSSGGCAALVAGCDEVFGAIGSDTGGSVRQPAVYCGIYGLKPSYGRLSRHGLVAYASSLDTVGVMARNLNDLELLFRVCAGSEPDPLDETSAVGNDANDAPAQSIGIPLEYRPAELDSAMEHEWRAGARRLRSRGLRVESCSLPSTRAALPAYYIIASAEASSNLARYDGLRYGRGREAFGDEVRRRILLGTLALSRGSFDQYYGQALRVREAVCSEFERALERVDCLLTPCVTSRTPPTIAEAMAAPPLDGYAQDALTVGASLAGLPALALPNGLQLIGRWGDERRLIATARALQE
jgi:aspartyl-tRNA(Asn)/glutamyl-tRNA(Gln) amidotransferase subunit A